MAPLVKRIFIGSSTTAWFQAKQLMKGCKQDGIAFVPWKTSFPAGVTLLEQLNTIRKGVDGALLLMTPELTVAGSARPTLPNQNVLLEFGFFYGAFDPTHVAMVRYGNAHLPGDLAGYTHIFGAKGFIPNGGNATSQRTHLEFDRWVRNWK